MGERAFSILESMASGLYWACVDFMIHSANLLGLTYRDTNAGMFFLLWPTITALLFVVVSWQSAVLRRRRAGGRDKPPPQRPSCNTASSP